MSQEVNQRDDSFHPVSDEEQQLISEDISDAESSDSSEEEEEDDSLPLLFDLIDRLSEGRLSSTIPNEDGKGHREVFYDRGGNLDHVTFHHPLLEHPITMYFGKKMDQ